LRNGKEISDDKDLETV